MTDRPQIYSRDGRAPIPKHEATSRVMSANKALNTGPEIALRKALWNAGLRGYRLHVKGLPGRPDIVYPKKKVAIFVNGCFWHRCPHCRLPLPKSNKEFWETKFARNKVRDRQKKLELKNMGWSVIEVWECKISCELSQVIYDIKNWGQDPF